MKKDVKVTFNNWYGKGKGTVIELGESRVLVGVDECDDPKKVGWAQDFNYEDIEIIK
jgi:hypothetical protein